MLKFFRRIRQKLINEGNLTRYLLYAIGEILLVMIGILLALQVNNWNEDRKRKMGEMEYLNGFKSDLENDLAAIEKILPIVNASKASINFMLDYMEKDLPWHDSLKYQFGNMAANWDIPFANSTYESISSNDWSIISNKKLREGLISYYRNSDQVTKQKYIYSSELFEVSRNVWSTRFEGFWETNYEEWKENNNYDSWENFRPEDNIGYAVPLNFEELKSDPEYRYSIIRLRNISNWYKEMAIVSLRRKAENILRAVDEALYGKE